MSQCSDAEQTAYCIKYRHLISSLCIQVKFFLIIYELNSDLLNCRVTAECENSHTDLKNKQNLQCKPQL